MKKLNNSGIAHHLLVLVIVVLAIAGGAGYLVWSRNNDKSASAGYPPKIYEINGTSFFACKKGAKLPGSTVNDIWVLDVVVLNGDKSRDIKTSIIPQKDNKQINPGLSVTVKGADKAIKPGSVVVFSKEGTQKNDIRIKHERIPYASGNYVISSSPSIKDNDKVIEVKSIKPC